ncbi:MAG: response regulator [Gallionellaceae bacterium]|nr:response regulator [Gallionellaceae bacterium]
MPEPTIYIVDDDHSVRDSLALLLNFRGFRTREFASAEAFIEAWKPDWRGCLLLDLRMTGMDGLALQQILTDQGSRLPIVFLTGHGDIAQARTALKAGAVDFLEKPIDHEALFQSLAEALRKNNQLQEAERRLADIEGRIARLSERERQVMERVVAGRHNREIAAELEISPRTVEVFKARMMEKMQARSVPELVKLVLEANPD